MDKELDTKARKDKLVSFYNNNKIKLFIFLILIFIFLNFFNLFWKIKIINKIKL